MANYCVINTDLMSGVKQPADLVSLRFYGSDGKVAEVENGVIVKLVEYETGEREVFKAVAATASDDIQDCAVVANPEVMYDERKKNLEDYINPAGKAIRGYRLRNNNTFSVTASGFVAAAPAKGGAVGVGTGGKIDSTGEGLGICSDIWMAGKRKFYAVQIDKRVTESEG